MQSHVRALVFIALAAIMTILAGCAPSEESASGEEASTGVEDTAVTEALAVEAAEVTRGRFIDPIRTSGTISGAQEALVVSETQGILQAVNIELGDTVEGGQVLVALDSSIERLNMEQAAAQVRSAELELQSTRRLYEQGNASEVQLRRAEAAARGAQAAYQQARKAFEDRTIEAPFGGRVASIGQGIDPGNFLARGAQVARLVDMSEVQVTVTVGERQVLNLTEGAPARIQLAGCPDRVYNGEVAAIAAGSDPATGGFQTVVRWTSECGPEVRAGMTADVVIEPDSAADALLVPAGAVVDTPEGPYLYVVEDGSARRRSIQIAERLGDRVSVASGLSEGEVIVLSGISALEDGSPVQVEVIGTTGELL